MGPFDDIMAGMDPMTMALMWQKAAQSPGIMGPILDATGMPLPGFGAPAADPNRFGNTVMPQVGNPEGVPGDPGMMSPVQAPIVAGVPAPGAPAVAGALQQQAPQQGMGLGQMAKTVPPNPVSPTMHGGVTGGVSSPKPSAPGNGSSQIAALMQVLLGQKAPPPVGTLGSYI